MAAGQGVATATPAPLLNPEVAMILRLCSDGDLSIRDASRAIDWIATHHHAPDLPEYGS